MSEEAKPVFSEWALLELMGHRRLAGLLTEQTVAGHGFLRLDIPGGRYNAEGEEVGGITQWYSPSSVYAITPLAEKVAREFARANMPAPVSRWDLPRLETNEAGGELDIEPDDIEDIG